LSSSTREKILDTALSLFNASGTRPVTTNHIAKECGIGMGNLYHYFRNKEDIIRTLYNRMGEEWDSQALGVEKMTMEVFGQIREHSDSLFVKYRFIHDELYTLCRIDPELAALNRERLILRKAQTKGLILALIRDEEFEPLGERELELLIDTIWMYAIFWHPYREMLSEGGAAAAPDFDRLIMKFLVRKQ